MPSSATPDRGFLTLGDGKTCRESPAGPDEEARSATSSRLPDPRQPGGPVPAAAQRDSGVAAGAQLPVPCRTRLRSLLERHSVRRPVGQLPRAPSIRPRSQGKLGWEGTRPRHQSLRKVVLPARRPPCSARQQLPPRGPHVETAVESQWRGLSKSGESRHLSRSWVGGDCCAFRLQTPGPPWANPDPAKQHFLLWCLRWFSQRQGGGTETGRVSHLLSVGWSRASWFLSVLVLRSSR